MVLNTFTGAIHCFETVDGFFNISCSQNKFPTTYYYTSVRRVVELSCLAQSWFCFPGKNCIASSGHWVLLAPRIVLLSLDSSFFFFIVFEGTLKFKQCLKPSHFLRVSFKTHRGFALCLRICPVLVLKSQLRSHI